MLYKYGRAEDYNGVSSICLRKLSSDGLTVTSDAPTQLFTVTAGQQRNGQAVSEDEGPNMVYHNGVFYIFFNVGTWCAANYRVAYAPSSTLMSSSTYTYKGILLQGQNYPASNITPKALGGISFVDDTTFIFMSYEPDAKLICQGTPKPPRNIHAGQLTYNPDSTVKVATTWSG